MDTSIRFRISSVCALKSLRDKYQFSLQSLRPIGARLRQFYDQPWAELRFYVYGDKLAFSDRDRQQLISASQFGQSMIETVTIDLQEVSREVDEDAKKLQQRSPEDVGQIVQRRLVYQSQPVVAGTRIPVGLIRQYIEDGYSIQEVLKTYPFLSHEDVYRALEWEPELKSVAS